MLKRGCRDDRAKPSPAIIFLGEKPKVAKTISGKINRSPAGDNGYLPGIIKDDKSKILKVAIFFPS